MNSEVNRFLFIVLLFLCVGFILIEVLFYAFTEVPHYVHVESNGFLRDVTASEYVGNRLDKRLEQVVYGTLVAQQFPKTFVSVSLVARKGCR